MNDQRGDSYNGYDKECCSIDPVEILCFVVFQSVLNNRPLFTAALVKGDTHGCARGDDNTGVFLWILSVNMQIEWLRDLLEIILLDYDWGFAQWIQGSLTYEFQDALFFSVQSVCDGVIIRIKEHNLLRKLMLRENKLVRSDANSLRNT